MIAAALVSAAAGMFERDSAVVGSEEREDRGQWKNLHSN